ncbi:hypothetical protein AKJ09_11061 [Labilithrix luteola]|uniref:Uncharacterized protein n=1 Tax=Labilithrix luteola TaxID=1391654 RepID=A0A0K1QF99_9BACT|nr:hypothetical protein [Labilithrix luteola]AKV04398.1 hypothetical protein AKJ09_11061 [Labilithrix luteola]
MTVIARRGLSPDFFADLEGGLLAPLRERVERDRTLCLELREDYINVYYRGGNVMRVSPAAGGYSAFFDPKYFEGAAPPMPSPRLRQPADVAAWITALPRLKEAMDLWLGRHAKDEREVQQQLLRDNNLGGQAGDTDFYVCDIEYANDHGRFDLVAVHWASTALERKKADGRRLVLGEVKYGDDALDGVAGLHAHVADVNAHLANPDNVAGLKLEMVRVFNQKRALGLMECKKDLVSFSDEVPMLLLVLVNHKPRKSKLRELLRTLPPSPHAELRIATGSLLGYGLYDPAVLTIEEALSRFETCI